MSPLLHAHDITRESDFLSSPDYNRLTPLQHIDRVYKAVITSIIHLTEMEKLFHVRIQDDAERERFTFLPGQFLMLEVPGYGEVPISISGSSSNRGFVELCIRKAGLVTSILHRARPGARVGIRGPFGTHFNMGQMKGHNILLVAGGLGLAPLRAPIYYATENRAEFKRVDILYGTKSPSELLFSYQYAQWRLVDGVNLQIIVEEADGNWRGEVGLVTRLIDQMEIAPDDTYAIVCGPPVMFKFVCGKLSERGVPMQRMFVSLERRMHCGMGKCYRCNVGHTSTCIDGAVFDYWSVMNLKEGI
jgi:NAD(P)H-flavin reductase